MKRSPRSTLPLYLLHYSLPSEISLKKFNVLAPSPLTLIIFLLIPVVNSEMAPKNFSEITLTDGNESMFTYNNITSKALNNLDSFQYDDNTNESLNSTYYVRPIEKYKTNRYKVPHSISKIRHTPATMEDYILVTETTLMSQRNKSSQTNSVTYAVANNSIGKKIKKVRVADVLSKDKAMLKVDDSIINKIFYDYNMTVNKVKGGGKKIKSLKTNVSSVTYFKDANVVKSNSTPLSQDTTSKRLEDTPEMIRHDPSTRLSTLNKASTHNPSFQNSVATSARPTFFDGFPANSSNRNVTILGLFELSVGDSPRRDGFSERAAAMLAVDHINKNNVLPGYSLQLITNDTKCDPGVGVDRLFHALYTKRETRMVMLLGTAFSNVTESIAKIVPYWNIVQVSFGSTSPALSDRNEFPLFCRTVAPDSSHNTARIAFIRQFGWDTVTAFSQNEEIYSLAVNELVTQLEAANITCAASITFAESDYKEQLEQLKVLDTRIIIGSFSHDMIPKIFCEAYKMGMFGAEYAWLLAGNRPLSMDGSPCPREELAAAVEGLILVDTHLGIDGDSVSHAGLTKEMFTKEMNKIGLPMSPYAPQTYDAVWTIALAMSKAEQIWRHKDTSRTNRAARSTKLRLGYFDYDRKDMTEEFLSQIANLSFVGVSGPVSFKGADRIATSAFYQIQEGEARVVALYTHGRAVSCGQCARAQWAGGIPAAKRVLVMRIDSVWIPARIAVSALAAAGVALTIGFLAFNLHYSKRRSIKLSSPRLNNMTLSGCVLVYSAVALLGVDSSILPKHVPFSLLCISRVYILSAGFSLAFGSMFAKTYRVHRIFISNRSGVCKTKLLQDTPLISLVCALLVIDGMIVTLWAMFDPMERHLKNLTVEISATERSVVFQPQIEICNSHNTAGWLCALYAYKGLLLLVGVYMAWETRNVKISALNDSKYIGISVYSVVITSTSVVVIGTIISDRLTLAYICISSLILLTTTSTLCLLFLPKIIAIKNNCEEDPIIQSMGLKLECKTRRFVTDDTQEVHFRIEIQNKVYKREVATLDKEIGRLEKMLQEPLESASTSTASIAVHRRSELNTVEEELLRPNIDQRNPSITGGLPMLLLSVLPPVIPRASWPSAESCRGRNSVSFSSQPKLNYRKSQPAIDLYSLCLTKRSDENIGLMKRLKSFFGSRPSSRKASTISIADPTSQSIATAFRMHVGMIAGLVPGGRKRSMVLSCNTLHVPHPEMKLRRESFAKSGPIIRVTDDEPSCSSYDIPQTASTSKGGQKYVAEPETRVNFVLPEIHKRPMSHQNSSEKFKGSPRFPHRISPVTSSLTTLDTRRKVSADSVFSISGKNFEEFRRYSHQNVNNEDKEPNNLENRWRSTEDAMAGPSGI